MARHLYELDRDSYKNLLAAEEMDVVGAVTVTEETLIAPDTTNRTILIGLGGTGVKTLDRIKRALEKALDPTWKKYVAFLAIDTDQTELDKVVSLKQSEGELLCITLNDADARLNDRERWPIAWRATMDDDIVKGLNDISGPGANQQRVVGRLKIHDKPNAAKGMDELIMERIGLMRTARLSGMGGNQNGKYLVYIIGSTCGGTSSGAFLEMPALVRRALGADNGAAVQVNAMLYLPDTFTGWRPGDREALEANGYASLKELNYYQGLSMREGSSETWTVNGIPNEITIQSNRDFFTMPFLIGTTDGEATDSYIKAQDSIAEFFISVLGKMTSSAAQNGQAPMMLDAFAVNAIAKQGQKDQNNGKINPGNAYEPAQNEALEFPRRFCAIGFAKASAPEQIISAYAVSTACKRAGLCAAEANDNLGAAALPPFRGSQDYLTAANGLRQAKEIVTPIINLMNSYQERSYNIKDAALKDVPVLKWDALKEGAYDGGNTLGKIQKWVADRTSSVALEELDKLITKAWSDYLANVKAYVIKEGPAAFWNLYEGNFIPEQGVNAVGIGAMLKNLRDGRIPETGVLKHPVTAVQAKTTLDDAKGLVNRTNPGLFQRVAWLVSREAEGQVAAWEQAVNAWVNAQVTDVRRDYLEGERGHFAEKVFAPAEELAKKIACFGDILAELAAAYVNEGQKLSTFAEFQEVRENTDVNIAAVDSAAYRWIKKEAENLALIVDGIKVREKLVEDFFADPAGWVTVDEDLVKSTNGKTMLKSKEKPISARTRFDECMRSSIQGKVNASIENLFANVQSSVSAEDFAAKVVNELNIHSQPLFDGNCGTDVNIFLAYPASLSQPVADAIKAAASLQNPQITFYASDYADSIMMYRQVAPFEVYKLNKLKQWEEKYEARMKETNRAAYGLHGLSPNKVQKTENGNVTYSQKFSWFDYPAITVSNGDPTKPDANGKTSIEGQRRIRMKAVLDEARKYGVLYSEEVSPNNWKIKRVWCDGTRRWDLDPLLMNRNAAGVIPMGKELAEEVAAQNNVTLATFTQDVCLKNGGFYSSSSVCPTEELAWKWAYTVLYSNMFMYAQVQDTLDTYFKVWGAQIDNLNAAEREKLIPAKLIRMIQGHVLYRDEAGNWLVDGCNLRDKRIVAMDAQGLRMVSVRKPLEAAAIRNGWTFYYVYKVLKEGQPAFLSDILQNIDDYVAEAMNFLMNPPSDAEFDEAQRLADEILAEADKLAEVGANLNNPEEISRVYLRNMTDKLGRNTSEEILREMNAFYSATRMWDMV